jgi:protein SCO1/2
VGPFAIAGYSGMGGVSSSSGSVPMAATDKPSDFADIGIVEKLGTQLDLSLPFTDETGTQVTLGKYFNGQHPVSLSLIYYACPGLCNFHFNGLVDALKKVDWSPGQNFQVLAISFDPRETFETGAKKRESYLKVYNRPGTENGIHFLTGSPEVIKKITEQVGFKYKWNEEAKDWSHSSAAIISTGAGKVSRYLHGIQFEPETLKLALNEAAEGKIGTIVDKMIWYCFRYDPHQSKYVLYAMRAVQFASVIFLIVFAAILLPMWLRGRKLR